MGQTTTVTIIERRQRGVFGWIFAVAFWAWQALMAAWMFAGLAGVNDQMASATSDAARAGTAVGVTLAATFIFIIWAAGSAVTGLLMFVTRGKLVRQERRS